MKSRTYIATPPGATIREQLAERGMNQKEFAARMSLSEKHVSRLLNGSVQLTPEVAFRLELVLGVPAKFWNNLEMIYREKLIKIEAEKQMEGETALALAFPYQEMEQYGWVPAAENAKEKVEYLRKYFGVVELALLKNELIMKMNEKRLDLSKRENLARMAWTQEVKIQARERGIAAAFNQKKLIHFIPTLRKMTRLKPEKFVPELLTGMDSCGIALVFLPQMKEVPECSVTAEDGNHVVIGMASPEEDSWGDIARFWCGLFQALASVILGYTSLSHEPSEEDVKETERWVENTLISQERFEHFKQGGNYSSQSVSQFARDEGIAPGIVADRMQREGLIDLKYMAELKKALIAG